MEYDSAGLRRFDGIDLMYAKVRMEIAFIAYQHNESSHGCLHPATT